MGDIAITGSTQQRRVWPPVVGLVAVMWVLELVDIVGPWDLDQYGIEPRSTSGLLGILFAPFLHGGLGHLIANTVPLVLLGLLVSWRAGRYFWPVVVTIGLASGLGVWVLAGTGTVTIGASGLVFGLLTYLIAAGIQSRRFLDVLVGVVVLLIYGTMLLQVLPFFVAPQVSWLGHLFGAVGGVLAALLFAESPKDPPRRG